jgi:predicted MPP superfamily phosphohydrolase
MPPAPVATDIKATHSRLTRRRFLGTSAAALGAAGLTGIYAWRIEPHWLEVVERDLPIANLPPALEGRRLVQISDLHVGPEVDSSYIIAALNRAAMLEPDLTVITGDFVSYRSPEHIDEVARVLKNLAPGSLGCAAILGNHDYGRAWSQTEVADSLSRKLLDLGIRVLRNASQSFNGLNIIGLDDLWGPHFNARTALANIDRDAANLVLCHNPDAVDLPAFANFQGWVLSGHTHGGQCKPPFLPPPLLPVRNRRYTSGAFDLGDGRWLYVNRGLGHLLRVRFNARPEITCFRLTGATAT